MGYLKIRTYKKHFKDKKREGILIITDTYHKDTTEKVKQLINSLKDVLKRQDTLLKKWKKS